MSFIQDFFTVNHEIIYFIYGLMFFVLGLAIALQSRYSSHLELARSLNWLAAFGFLHGFHEWGDLFIPLQAEYMAPGIILFLNYIHLLLLAVSFACLYGFGLALLEPLKHRRWLHIAFAAVLISWLVLSLGFFRIWFTDFDIWNNSVDALTRYFIGLPSGLLAAYALREHTFKRIAPYDVPRIVRALQLAGIAMAIYAFAAGLIVPPVSFFPGNWLNTDTFARYLVVPPQLFRALIGLAMAMTTIRFLEIFDVETARRIEAMHQQQMLADERERIARELHDGTIQKVYTAALLVRSAQNLAGPDTPLTGRLGTAVGVLDDVIGDLRRDLVELRPPDQSPEPLKLALQKLATDPRFNPLVTVEVNLDLPDSCSLSPEQNVHVLAIVQETLANAVRHAHARRVSIAANCKDGHLCIAVKDDGGGIPEQVIEGHGMRNMRDRASLLHGQLAIERLSKGTRVTLDFPWEERI
ncbi:MAG TPA: sensor histidine kinase [Anaerolineales bacterium]|nr:sensor histidine kinase [Anaerolineales bacterium]